jgi:hypothetical protein
MYAKAAKRSKNAAKRSKNAAVSAVRLASLKQHSARIAQAVGHT